MALELPPSGTHGSDVPKPLRPLFFKAMSGVGGLMFRRGMKVQGRPLLRLTTIGAKTGKERRAVLGWFPDPQNEDSWLIVASNGGAAGHPGWAYNLASNPEQALIEIDEGDTVEVGASLITGREREEAWSRVTDMAPGYENYTTKTDRQLPVFRLTRR